MNVPELPGRFDYVLRLCDIFVSLSESLQSLASAPLRIMQGCSEKHLITLEPTSWSVKEVLVR